MNQPVTLFQTLRDDGNPDDVEKYGPFKCTRPSAWLGHGFYFWDSHIELGHWWGNVANGSQYIICQARAVIDNSCFGLHGNGKHRIEFKEACRLIIEAGISTKKNLLVAQVIEFLKKRGIFKYQAIRALGINSVGGNPTDNYVVYRLKFVRKSDATYMDLHPPVQFCLITKTALSLQNFKIVYPPDYVEEYT